MHYNVISRAKTIRRSLTTLANIRDRFAPRELRGSRFSDDNNNHLVAPVFHLFFFLFDFQKEEICEIL